MVGGDVLADGAPCESAGIVDGVCNFGVCAESVCGDGIVVDGEACDLGNRNSDVDPDACRTDCTPFRCGDGVVDRAEVCDTDVGLGGSCESCGALLCIPGTGNCDLDGATGCECESPRLIDDGVFPAIAINNGSAIVVTVQVFAERNAVEVVDLDSGARSVIATFVPSGGIGPIVVADGVFVAVGGSAYRVDSGALLPLRVAVDEDDRLRSFVASGASLVGRTANRIMRFDRDGRNEVTLADWQPQFGAEGDNSLAVTPAGEVVFVESGQLWRVRVDGSDGIARVDPIAPTFDRTFQAAVAAVDDNVYLWTTRRDVTTLLRITSSTSTELLRLGAEDQPGRRIEATENTVFVCTAGLSFTRQRLLAVPVAGGQAQTLVGTDCTFAFDGSDLVYREGAGNLRIARFAP